VTLLAALASPPDPPPTPRSIVELLRQGMLDTDLAALAWLLLEARVPVIVVGRRGSGRTTLLAALLDFVAVQARAWPVGGAGEQLAWLPEAARLGWHPGPGGSPGPHGSASSKVDRSIAATRRDARPPALPPPIAAAPSATLADPTTDVLLVPDLADRSPGGTWGTLARTVIRAVSLGYGMAATMVGDGLEDVLRSLSSEPVNASADEVSNLGLVLVLRGIGTGPGAPPGPRIVAAHYLRPVARDVNGHVRRLPPAVVATFDAAAGVLEHFAWGIGDELAGRTGRRTPGFEREQARRSLLLRDLAEAGVEDPAAVREAIIAGVVDGERPLD
jgi:hypothetical protein